jgi:ABC-type uncharacterized transport system YnjBCD permease subunit
LDPNLFAVTVGLSASCSQILKLLWPQEWLGGVRYFTAERQNMVLSLGGLALAVALTYAWSNGITDPLQLFLAWLSAKGLYHGAKSAIRTVI